MGYPVCPNRIHSSGINGPWKSLFETTKSFLGDGHRLKLFLGVWESGAWTPTVSQQKNVGMKIPKYRGILNIDQTLTVFNCSLAPEAKDAIGKTHSKDFDSLETRPFSFDNPNFGITFLASNIKP